MADVTLLCDQAIFTSTRTPTGEGYRIIAASGELRPNEKQAITRSSPSHDALCLPDIGGNGQDTYAAAFYGLPTERFCIAYSCYAGAEHTGRGGQRVYTHNVIVDEEGLERCENNPFAILRAMRTAGLFAPTLKPKSKLPQLELRPENLKGHARPAPFDETLTSEWRTSIVDSLLGGESLIVNLAEGWAACAEAFVMALPGPLRTGVSFAAGLRFSVARVRRLCLVLDDPKIIKSKSAGHHLVYIDPPHQQTPDTSPSAWAAFVDRHWQHDQTETLVGRTSRPFLDVSIEGRDRIARLYNRIDDVESHETPELLQLATQHLVEPEDEIEADITGELLLAAQRAVVEKLALLDWDVVHRQWPAICSLWRRSAEGCLLALPLIEKTLELAARVHPMVAAEVALGLTIDAPLAAEEHSHLPLIERVLTRFADWAGTATDAEIETVPALCEQWQGARPTCPIVERLLARCAAMSTNDSSTS